MSISHTIHTAESIDHPEPTDTVYFSPPRPIRQRRVPVDAHDGTRADFLDRHAAEAKAAALGDAGLRTPFLGALHRRAIDCRNLYSAAEHVVSEGGAAPGVDGVSSASLDHRDVAHLVRTLHCSLADGTYRPGASRKVNIPKPYGRGVRTLSIPLVADRIVQRAIVQVVQPYLDPQFEPTTLGGRPGMSTAHALAMVDSLSRRYGYVLVTADIAKAFDVVPHDPLMRSVRLMLGTTPLTELIERIVCTNGTIGIAQGGGLSPLLLNLYLDQSLDKTWRNNNPNQPLIRWVDDILILCPNRTCGQNALTDLTATMTATGMPLKTNPAPNVHELHRGERTPWLGHSITSGKNGLKTEINETAWNQLRLNLQKSHYSNHPSVHANSVIMGWINAIGPTFDEYKTANTVTTITKTAQMLGFDEIAPAAELVNHWRAAYERFNQIRQDIESAISRDWGEASCAAASLARISATIVPFAVETATPRTSTQPDPTVSSSKSYQPSTLGEHPEVLLTRPSEPKDRSSVGGYAMPQVSRQQRVVACYRPSRQIDIRNSVRTVRRFHRGAGWPRPPPSTHCRTAASKSRSSSIDGRIGSSAVASASSLISSLTVPPSALCWR